MNEHTLYMRRCFELARLGLGRTTPNPVVGAVMVHKNRIIGEGYHSRYGHPHAEVEAVRSVSQQDRHLIPDATLYVSLEPCSVHGRTPPCTDLITGERIPRVVIAYRDHSPGVNGTGVTILKEQGVEVIEGVLEDEGKRLSAPRNIFVTEHRPYIILKYARSADGFLAPADGRPYWLTNAFSRRLVHRWRSEVDGIMVGSRTAEIDNPKLNTRLYPGKSPIRIIPDRNLRLSVDLHIFDDSVPTRIYTHRTAPQHRFTQTDFVQIHTTDFFQAMLQDLHAQNIQTIMIEGGKGLLDYLFSAGYWDEARVFTCPQYLRAGLPAPLPGQAPDQVTNLRGDRLEIFYRR